MISSSILIGCTILSLACGADPKINIDPSLPQGPDRQFLLPSGAQSQYSSELHQNLNILEPQFQYPGLNFPQNQPYPGVQPQPPQVLIYATPGQQFLYNPGAPPGNFLIPQPQPQPGVYFNGGNPQVPAFDPSNYPRPAYVPPIEKDAEEIPTNLNKGNEAPPVVPQFFNPPGSKPQKLETFDEPARGGSEVDDLEGTVKNVNPKVYNKKPVLPNNIPQLKPGQQFFILNGQDLFSGFPFQGQQPILQPGLHQPNPEVLIYGQQPQYLNQPQDLFQRNTVTGQISDIKPNIIPNQNENLVDINQPNDFRQSYFINNPFPFPQHQLINNDQIDKQEDGLLRTGKTVQQPNLVNYYQQVPYFNNLPAVRNLNKEDEDDTVVIDAKIQSDEVKNEEVVSSTTKKPEEPSLSQADPAAIAVAGVGGVAEAAPRGTALTGNKGLAVSSPKATAVAGPKLDEPESKENPKKE